MQSKQSALEFNSNKADGMDTSSHCRVLDNRRYSSGQCTIGREEEDRNNLGRAKRSKNMKMDMAEDR